MTAARLLVSVALLVLAGCDKNDNGGGPPNNWANICVGSESRQVYRLHAHLESMELYIPEIPVDAPLQFPLSFSVSTDAPFQDNVELTLDLAGEDIVGRTVVEGSVTWVHNPDASHYSDYWVTLCLAPDRDSCNPPDVDEPRCGGAGASL